MNAAQKFNEREAIERANMIERRAEAIAKMQAAKLNN